MKLVAELLDETKELGLSNDFVLGFIKRDGCINKCVINDESILNEIIDDEKYVDIYNSMLFELNSDEKVHDSLIDLSKSTVVLNAREMGILNILLSCVTNIVEDDVCENKQIDKEYLNFMKSQFNEIVDLENKLSSELEDSLSYIEIEFG